jgi:antitoxin PrlF
VESAIVRGGALPGEVRAALHVGEDDEVAFVDSGHGIVVAPADQAWYWAREWQEGEREADADLAAGRTRVFGSGEEFLASLEDAIDDPNRF